MSDGISPQMPRPGRTSQGRRVVDGDSQARLIRFLTEDDAHRFGARLRARRQELGVPLDELATSSEVSPGEFVAVEGGLTPITVGQLGWIALTLRVTGADLLHELGYFFGPARAEDLPPCRGPGDGC